MHLSAEILLIAVIEKPSQDISGEEGAARLLALYWHIRRLFRLELAWLEFPELSSSTAVAPSGEF